MGNRSLRKKKEIRNARLEFRCTEYNVQNVTDKCLTEEYLDSNEQNTFPSDSLFPRIHESYTIMPKPSTLGRTA